jgi:hypothetical protein
MNARNTTQADAGQKSAIAAATEGQVLTLTFQNGEVLALRAGELSEEVRGYALMHGLKQKLVDAAAIARNPENGRAASIQDKYNAVRTVVDRLRAGQWNAVRGEGGGAGAGGLLFRALCRMYAGKKTEAAIRDYLAGKTDAEKAALRKNPRVAGIIETLKAEDGRDAGPDAGADLLDELDSI